MEWKIDNNKPVYIQLVELLKVKIISGEIELDSIVDSVRTCGRFVTDYKELIENERKNLVKDNVKKTLDTLINLGYTNDEILSLVEEILREDNNE